MRCSSAWLARCGSNIRERCTTSHRAVMRRPTSFWTTRIAESSCEHSVQRSLGYGWVLHAFCLMRNHYHLLLQTPQPNLSRGMRQVNGVYTQCFNRRHEHVGHVFQGRFGGVLVERESYLLELARYVPLNPVRAGFVSSAGQWPWS